MKSISLSNVSFAHPSGKVLFDRINAIFNNRSTVAIIGDNGCGKTTLLNIIAGQISPDAGRVTRGATIYIMRQLTPYNDTSGGQHQWDEITRAFNSNADILLLDEPTNNLDSDARRRFYNMMRRWPGGIIVVSHDRELLSHIDTLIELRDGKLTTFGGNYEFYCHMRDAQRENMISQYVDTTNQIKRLKHTAIVANTMATNHIAKQARDRANTKRSRLEGNALKGKSTETAARRNQIINKKISEHQTRRDELSNALRDDKIKIPIPHTTRHGQELINIRNMSFGYDANNTVFNNFSFQMRGGERIRIIGNNGCGKTTLIRLILGEIQPTSGDIKCTGRAIYLDQTLSALCPDKSIVDNIIDFGAPDINSAYAIAANFGFRATAARQIVGTLSGGELLKATLAAVIGGEHQPDLLILDEPTNNLDIKSMEILANAINQFRGALILISHDDMFAGDINGIEYIKIPCIGG